MQVIAIKFLKETVKHVSGATLLALASLFFVALPVNAETTYELPAPIQVGTVDFPITGSGVSGTPNYDFGYKIPLGIQFDRIQISVPDSQGTTKTPYVAIYNNVGTWFYSCVGSNCIADDTEVSNLGTPTQSVPQVGTLQWVFSTTTTVTNANHYFRFLLDGSTPYTDFYYNGTEFLSGASMNGWNYTKTKIVPTIKFCNGACDNNDFSPIPNLTASPWARITSPQSSTTQPYSFNVYAQYNTGTTSVHHAVVSFESSNQSLVPYVHYTTSTGLNSFNFNKLFPEIDDTISVKVTLYDSSSTTIQVSPTYVYKVRSNVDDVVADVQTCDSFNPLLSGICSIFQFIFVPSEDSVNSVTDLWTEMQTKMPFVYVFQASDLMTGLYSGTASSIPALTLETGIGDLTIISEAQVSAVPYVGTLRSLIGAGLWLMLFTLLYRKTLSVHDKQTV